MKRQEATNTFQEGMIMDLNPLVTPNNVLTNCLNGTLLTYNGNENVLQNDMGNGRVETAYLPEGYVPLGTAELGGIIYIVSYNPLKNKCQVGSFPSPERNVSSDEVSDNICSLSESDFQFNEETGASIYYVKKDLNQDLIFNPGDKFIVYGDHISSNYSKFYDISKYNDLKDNLEEASNQTIKLELGAVTKSGELIKFSDLKQYTLEDNKKYHILQYVKKQEEGKPDIDDYRKIIEQPYNVFSSKVSGSLVLVAELVQCTQFSTEFSHTFLTNDGDKYYIPGITFELSGDYPFIPFKVQGKLILENNENLHIEHNFEHRFSIEDVKNCKLKDNYNSYKFYIKNFLDSDNPIKSKLDELAREGYFLSENRNKHYNLRYEFVPCMNWGPINYLKNTGEVNLDKLGTGYIEISSWRYYNESKRNVLTWGLEVYEEEGFKVDHVDINFNRLLSKDKLETSLFKANNKRSYHGIFQNNFIFGANQTYLDKPLLVNKLYLVDIVVYYCPNNYQYGEDMVQDEQYKKHFYRWLYTSSVFNEYYKDTIDFKELSLKFNLNPTVNNKASLEEEDSTTAYGILTETLPYNKDEQKRLLNQKTSLSASQSRIQQNQTISIHTELQNQYGMFDIEIQKDAIDLTLGLTEISATSNASSKYIGDLDPYFEQYLQQQIDPSVFILRKENETDEEEKYYNIRSGEYLENLDRYMLKESDGQDISNDVLSLSNITVLDDSETQINFEGNTHTLTLNSIYYLASKGYCSKVEDVLSYLGRYLPLAYNDEQFSYYNMAFGTDGVWGSGDHWYPLKLGLYGFYEVGGEDGRAFIGCFDTQNPIWTEPCNTEVYNDDNVELRWLQNQKIAEAEINTGWTTTTMFALHLRGSSDWGSFQECWDSGRVFSSSAQEQWLWPGKKWTNIILTMRSNQGTSAYYPINFGSWSDAYGIGETFYKKDHIDMYSDFASLLNNIYKYYNATYTLHVCRPQNISYQDTNTLSIHIPIEIKSTEKIEESTININLGDKQSIDIKELLNSFNNFLGLNLTEYDNSLKNNISFVINTLCHKLPLNISYSDVVGGRKLRDYMISKQNMNGGIAVFDYDGTTLIGNMVSGTINSSILYMRNGNIVIPLSNFRPIKMKYSRVNKQLKQELVTDKDGNYVYLCETPLNLNKQFQLSKDLGLILKNPKNGSGDIGFRLSGYRDLDSNHDIGYSDGYSIFSLLPKYCVYQGTPLYRPNDPQ